MNVSTDLTSTNPLYCELCDFIQFSTYTEFQIHHLNHIRQPLVRLVKLNPNLCAKIQARSYRVNTGVARTSHVFDHVPPLRLSIVKQQGSNQFSVKKGGNCSGSNSPNLEDNSSDFEPGSSWDEARHKALLKGLSDVEGKHLLERFGAKISISRKGKPPPPLDARDEQGNGNHNGRKDSEPSPSVLEMKKGNVFERLSGIGGISISTSTKNKPSPNGNTETKLPSGISISSKQRAIDISELKLIKDQDGDSEKKVFDKNKILEKLSGSGLICIGPKAPITAEGEEEEGEEDSGGKPEAQEALERLEAEGKSEDSNESSDSRSSSVERTCQVSVNEVDNGNVVNSENSSRGQKTYVRVKQSSFSKNSIRQGSHEEPSEERTTGGQEEGKENSGVPEESGIDILERLTDNLNNSVGVEKSAGATNSEVSNSEEMEEPLLSGNCAVGGIHSQLNELQSDSIVATEPEFHVAGEKTQEQESEADNVSEENNETDGHLGSFTSLSNEDQNPDQGEQQTAFWSDIRNTPNSIDQPQEDPLLTPENPVSNGEGINFLQNFLTDHQSPPGNLPPENSEFMSLDRLGQTQHQQPPYLVNNNEPNSPMEQLSQQVQRIPNPTPQINVISQHHLQAPPPPPPPPQLHTGVPLSPQHISPQQANAYDALGRIPPHMPPPLYPGYSMYNTNYPPQSQMPSPGMLPQRAIQPRPFQTMAAQRPRLRAVKRTAMRPPPPDITTSKQRRVDPPLQVRPQVQNPTAKLPSGITVTPPKKTIEANKVANVLASRGITVTPTASRQISRPTPKSQGSSPVLNISSAVSISSSHNRSNGGFAVPGPRRNTPIVNHHVERPERCTTVDLTQDEDMPQPSRRAPQGRYQCSQCSKTFASSQGLETHRAAHRTSALPFRCDKCPAQYTSMANLQQHKVTCHKKQSDLAIPIVDLNHPGAREQLLKCGVYNFIPLAQLQSNNNGYFGVPIIQLDTAKEKAVSNLSLLGAGNILVLGKMKALAPNPSH